MVAADLPRAAFYGQREADGEACRDADGARVADEVGARTIAFPAISTGAYAYPPDEAARLAVEALQYAKTNVEYAEFVLLDITLFDAFMNAMFDDDQAPPAMAPRIRRPRGPRKLRPPDETKPSVARSPRPPGLARATTGTLSWISGSS